MISVFTLPFFYSSQFGDISFTLTLPCWWKGEVNNDMENGYEFPKEQIKLVV